MHEVTTITPIKVENPAAFTIGPINHTAKELTPNETANRMPETRDRISVVHKAHDHGICEGYGSKNSSHEQQLRTI